MILYMAESIYIEFLDEVKTMTNNYVSKYTDNVNERLTRFHTSFANEYLFSLFILKFKLDKLTNKLTNKSKIYKLYIYN